jgi:hypothetical protein
MAESRVVISAQTMNNLEKIIQLTTSINENLRILIQAFERYIRVV